MPLFKYLIKIIRLTRSYLFLTLVFFLALTIFSFIYSGRSQFFLLTKNKFASQIENKDLWEKYDESVIISGSNELVGVELKVYQKEKIVNYFFKKEDEVIWHYWIKKKNRWKFYNNGLIYFEAAEAFERAEVDLGLAYLGFLNSGGRDFLDRETSSGEISQIAKIVLLKKINQNLVVEIVAINTNNSSSYSHMHEEINEI